MDEIDLIRQNPPSDFDRFEWLCKDLWQVLWGACTARHGRRGQKQRGVDVYAQLPDRRWAGVQCKVKSPTGSGRPELSVAEIKKEIEQARTFRPELSLLVVATTAPRDGKTQTLERKHNDAKDRPFELQLRFWDDIAEELVRYPELVHDHYGFLRLAESTRRKLQSYLTSLWRDRLELPAVAGGSPHTLPAVYTRSHLETQTGDTTAVEDLLGSLLATGSQQEGSGPLAFVRTDGGPAGGLRVAEHAGCRTALVATSPDSLEETLQHIARVHSEPGPTFDRVIVALTEDLEPDQREAVTTERWPFQLEIRDWSELRTTAHGFRDLWWRHFPLLWPPQPRARSLEVWEGVARHRLVVLTGEAGSGKSSFASWLALCLAGDLLDVGKTEANLTTLAGPAEGERDPRLDWLFKGVVPVWIELRSLVDSEEFGRTPVTANNLWDYVARRWELDRDVRDELDRQLAARGPHRGVMLILDGLDEMPNAARVRDRLKQTVTAVLRDAPGCRVLVTSRPWAYRKPEWKLSAAAESTGAESPFVELALAPFGPEQVNRFVTAWFADDEEKAQALRRALTSPRLAKLAERPLLLRMLAELCSAGRTQTLTGDPGQFYREAVDLLFDRWNSERRDVPCFSHEVAKVFYARLPDDPGSERDAVLASFRTRVHSALRELAFRALQKGEEQDRRYLRLSDFQLALRRWTADLDEAEDGLNEGRLLHFLSRRSGLLRAVHEDSQSEARYEFMHGSLQESLAAEFLLANPDLRLPQDLGGHDMRAVLVRDPSLWGEVATFCVLHARDVWGVVRHLVPRGAAQEPDLQLAVRVVQGVMERGVHLGQVGEEGDELLDRLRDRLVTGLAGGLRLIDERLEAGEQLGQLRDPRLSDGPENLLPVAAGADQALARFPVTVQEFAAFVEAGGYTDDDLWRHEEGRRERDERGWSSPGRWEAQRAHPNWPVTGVSWWEAEAYCAWRRRETGVQFRLPTSDEWTQAAFPDDRPWPWGKSPEPSSELANYDWQVGHPSPVGCYPAGAGHQGHLDLGGNVWEWTAGPERDLRGGSWLSGAGDLRAGSRFHGVRPDDRGGGLGFRVSAPASR